MPESLRATAAVCRSIPRLCGRPGSAWRGRAVTRSGLSLMLAALVLGLLPSSVAGQERVVITGSVQWIDGSRMEVMADSGYSISVNLTQVDQSSYNTLSPGDRVRVVGVVSPDRSQLIAERVVGGATNIYDDSRREDGGSSAPRLSSRR